MAMGGIISDDDIVKIERASADASVVAIAPEEYDKLVRLCNKNDAYLHDAWTDIPKSGLGTIR